MTQKIIQSLIELEAAAASSFWVSEDRSAWKEELLRFAETKSTPQLKPHLSERPERALHRPLFAHVDICDDELIRIFGGEVMPRESDEDQTKSMFSIETQNAKNISGVYLSPGFWMEDSWQLAELEFRKLLEQARQNEKIVFRNGFFNQAADILMTADLGFTGIQLHVHHLDLFELQMAVELARDCRLCPIVSAATYEELELAIQTDAPHLGLCYFPGLDNHEQEAFIQRAILRIPKDCTRTLFASIKTEAELNYLSSLPFDLVFQFYPRGF